MKKNEFYILSIEYGRELLPECGNVDYCLVSNNKEVIVNEFMQGLKNELSFDDVIIEDNTMSLDEIEKELKERIDLKRDYRVDFYKDLDEYNTGYERFSYVCTLVNRK